MTVREEGFSRYVGLSVGAHLAVVAAVFTFLWLGRHVEPAPPATFELVGTQGLPEGSRGAAEGGSQAPEPPAQQAPQAQQTEEPSAPEPVPTPESPTPKGAVVLPEKSTKAPKAPAKPDAKAPAKPTASSKAASTGNGSGSASGPGKGKGGSGTDTLEVGSGGGGGGAPSYMSAWLTRVRTLVERQWRLPDGAQAPKGAPVVVFVVARDGRPGRPALVSGSGNPLVDRLALRAVAAVETFPPPPDAWPKAEVKLRYVLEVRSP
jgi:TonB family protein